MNRLLSRAILPGLVAALFLLSVGAEASTDHEFISVADAAAKNKLSDVAELLLDGKSVDSVDNDGRTGLHYAAMYGNFNMALLLLQHDASPNIRDRLGLTPLHWAAEGGSVDIIALLLRVQVPIDASTHEGLTPLMLAVDHNEGDAVRLLLQNGADPTKTDFSGRDAEGWAAGKPAMLQILRQAKGH